MMASRSQNQDSHNSRYQYSCTLLVPGLLSIPQSFDEYTHELQQQLTDLELFLARAKCKKTTNDNFEATIFDYFGVQTASEQSIPVAAVSYLGDTGKIAGQWVVRADPVHLMPSRDELILTGPENLSLTRAEAEHIAAVLNDFYKEDGWYIEVATPERWYLHLPVNPDVRTHKLSEVLDKAIGEFMPHGSDERLWRRVMNEVQMVLHHNDVNVQRQSENQLPVNSLWFWGEGDLPAFGHSRWSQLWSIEPVSLGLAQLTRTPRDKLPTNSHEWLSKINTPGEHLLIYNHLQSEMYMNPETWNNSLNNFQENWLKPLLQALRDGEIDQLTLDPCNGKKYRLSSGGLKRWWARKKPVYAYCS